MNSLASDKISRALVTGANGFMGLNLCAHLRAQGIATSGLILPGSPRDALAALEVEIVEADIGSPLSPALFEGVSHVFHLAAIPFDWGPLDMFMRVNAEGTRHVLEASIAASVHHVVHMSSLAVHAYDGHEHGDENTPRGWDLNGYTRSKNAAEDYVQQYRDRLMLTIIRPGIMPYGPGDRLSMPGLVEGLKRGIYRHVGGGYQRLCLSYIGNLVEGLQLAAERQGPSGEVYVLADEVLSWRELLKQIASTFDVPEAKNSIPYAVAYAAAVMMEKIWRMARIKSAPPLTRYRIALFRGDLVFSSAKARRELGYRPKVGLAQGLAMTKAWMKKEGLG